MLHPKIKSLNFENAYVSYIIQTLLTTNKSSKDLTNKVLLKMRILEQIFI